MKLSFLLFSLALAANPLLAETRQKISIPENARKDGVTMLIESTIPETNERLPDVLLYLKDGKWVNAPHQKIAKAKRQDVTQQKALQQERPKVLGAKNVPKNAVVKTKPRTHTFAHIVKKPASAKKRVSATYIEIR
jgi:ABC-type multidrug transport system ATPase subunit